MRKSTFTKELASRAGLSSKSSERAVNCMLELLTETLAKGQQVQFMGFGTFLPRQVDAYTGKHPITGLPTEHPAKIKIVFKTGSELSAALNAVSETKPEA
jgi:DNA-binding protein HU-beta